MISDWRRVLVETRDKGISRSAESCRDDAVWSWSSGLGSLVSRAFG